MRNYDTTKGLPYPRITQINITYSENGKPTIEYTERTAIVDASGSVQHIDSGATRHVLNLDAITEPVQIVNPATGEAIPGMTTTGRQVMLSLLAFLRADQKRRDAPPAPVIPEPALPEPVIPEEPEQP